MYLVSLDGAVDEQWALWVITHFIQVPSFGQWGHEDVFQFQSIQSQAEDELIMDSPLQDERLRLLITRVHS